MKKQKEEFKISEADQWFERNKLAYQKSKDKESAIALVLKDIEIKPTNVLEIGCSSGIKLESIRRTFGASCYGIDPSSKAIEEGKKEYSDIFLQVGAADVLPFEDEKFDVIIFGFCLYLCDRSDLFKIAYEANRCLSDKGYIVIEDFCPPFPYKNNYTHKENIFSYKMDYAQLFLWNPAYNLIYKNISSHSGYSKRDMPDEKVAITILNKQMEFAYPPNPYR